MTAMHDAARQAALDERDRLDVDVSDYVALSIAEAALAVIDHEHPIIDCEGWDE